MWACEMKGKRGTMSWIKGACLPHPFHSTHSPAGRATRAVAISTSGVRRRILEAMAGVARSVRRGTKLGLIGRVAPWSI